METTIETARATEAIDDIEVLIGGLAERLDANDMDRIAILRDKLDFVLKRAKEADKACEAMMLAWIEANKQDITIGPIRYYAGVGKKTRCVDKPGTLAKLLEVAGGDMAKACEFFSSDPYKHGAIRAEVKPEDFEALFAVEITAELKEGKPVKGLQKFDERFSK